MTLTTLNLTLNNPEEENLFPTVMIGTFNLENLNDSQHAD